MVDTDQPGFARSDRAQDGPARLRYGSISLEDVEVSDEDMLGGVGDGFKVAMSNLESGRYSVAAGAVGICQGCVDESVKYSTEREQFGKPIASFQLVQAMIAEMVLKTEASRMLVWRAGFLKDQGRPNTLETSIAKLHATEASLECANLAIQVHGGAGYVDDHPVERYLRDARVTTIYEGTSQIQQLIIGRAMTGVNAMVPRLAAADRWPRTMMMVPAQPARRCERTGHRRHRRGHDGLGDRPAGRAQRRADAAVRPDRRGVAKGRTGCATASRAKPPKAG